MKAVVDEDLCIGCEACEDVCPEVFRVEDDGYSHVIAENPDPDLYECIRDAVDGCPTTAISVTA
jgi:ferredoxin